MILKNTFPSVAYNGVDASYDRHATNSCPGSTSVPVEVAFSWRWHYPLRGSSIVPQGGCVISWRPRTHPHSTPTASNVLETAPSQCFVALCISDPFLFLPFRYVRVRRRLVVRLSCLVSSGAGRGQGDLENTMTRDEVFRRLITLGVGLNVTFVLWGVLQVWCGVV